MAARNAAVTQGTPTVTAVKASSMNTKNLIPGILVTLGLAFLAQWLGGLAPIIGGPIIAIVLGIAVRNLAGMDASIAPGVAFTSKKILQASIILLGGSLSLTQIWQTGVDSMAIMLVSLAVGVLTGLGLGKVFGVPWRLSSLIAAGTSICGASAIAAVAPGVKADDDEVAYSISTVFLFNVAAVFVFPLIGHFIGLSDTAFGLWAGTAINDTSSVVAAGYSWSHDAGVYATIVKLARTSMIIPMAFLFAAWGAQRSRKAESQSFSLSKIIPWFIVWFMVAALLNSVGLLGNILPQYLNSLGKFGIIMALAAVGLGADFRKMAKTGFRPVLLGLATWVVLAAVSLTQILLTVSGAVQ